MIDSETIAKLDNCDVVIPSSCCIPVFHLPKALRLVPLSPTEIDEYIKLFGDKILKSPEEKLPGISLTSDASNFARGIVTEAQHECQQCPNESECALLVGTHNKSDDVLPLLRQKTGTVIKQRIFLNGIAIPIIIFPQSCTLSPKEINSYGSIESPVSPYSNLVLMQNLLSEEELIRQTIEAFEDTKFIFDRTPPKCNSCNIPCPFSPEEV